jgi:sorting nexin-1/2
MFSVNQYTDTGITDLSLSISDFSDTITALAESDLSMDLSQALQRLSGLTIREKEAQENQAKMDVVYLLNTADEYVRWIGSVRVSPVML